MSNDERLREAARKAVERLIADRYRAVKFVAPVPPSYCTSSDLARYAVLTGEDVEAVQDEDGRTGP